LNKKYIIAKTSTLSRSQHRKIAFEQKNTEVLKSLPFFIIIYK